MSGVWEKIDFSNSLGGELKDIKYFNELISRENLLASWQKFCVGKWRQQAVRNFWLNLEWELASLYHDLSYGCYYHGSYDHFIICDPKRRDIYVAKVRDRVTHQVLFDYLNMVYEPIFYFHSYASREGKGLHKAVSYFLSNFSRLSRSGNVWAVKMDVRKFFNNVRHDILYGLLKRRIDNQLILGLIKEIVSSFSGEVGQGLPLGNLTSQVLANVYMQELDFYIKNVLRIKCYLRYNDDLLFLCHKQDFAFEQSVAIREFAAERLRLEIPLEKTFIISSPQIIDILGRQTDGSRCWIRPQTISRAKKKMEAKFFSADKKYWDSACSYAGIMPPPVFGNNSLI